MGATPAGGNNLLLRLLHRPLHSVIHGRLLGFLLSAMQDLLAWPCASYDSGAINYERETFRSRVVYPSLV
ncbi:hypothetical protein E2C01_043773 [Portunus trituberculatus]|uniref:Uncharacterized protein n=1 Tax=Portunus trituberculatus TaxID=210409 RepID=A0A5B7FYM4_PORTR|nr:hypothetical protein [Portunus trituberculatus]